MAGKLKSSSIIESIIAALIIMISFGIGTMAFTSFIFPSNRSLNEKALHLLNETILQVSATTDTGFHKIERQGMIIQLNITPYKGKKNLLKIEGQVIDNHEKIIAKKRVLTIKYLE